MFDVLSESLFCFRIFLGHHHSSDDFWFLGQRLAQEGKKCGYMCGKSKEDKAWQRRSRDETICYFRAGLPVGRCVFVSSARMTPAFPLLEFSKGTANKLIL